MCVVYCYLIICYLVANLAPCSSWAVSITTSPNVTVKYCEKALQRNNPCYTNKDYVVYEDFKRCYKYNETAVYWVEAYMLCKRDGAYLAVINSKKEAELLLTIKGDRPGDSTHIGFLYIQGQWVTTDGQSLKDAGYDTWSKDQPSYTNYGEVREMFGSLCIDGLNDLINETKKGYFCEHNL